ncbi:4a-hydroxytetrahydrobiopterin dehydratase [Rhodospirillum rubrum]|uniref:Putative pterin-4-alpha-carbinolamine dehydratase n=1 Tax=Rhodospirillum rubrum (strain ATCC 11170 / ATH 1.1.1 / DSM 467 / LMG 4362 / NCIMB 8255 / S1) TaxID=269796 RepID=PHS_RHORT|nr:4a-hydroxytetrahydrobiopterin dehydratase [Rhodospirillum rubrum]Q2RNC0.1 RecName: Full=Putative pterin-4-alpha-carbinolamine dehydratase; Short=PHS; AltName: Full=4-alpha-hydroxy-tetrahydropterin dehydratase; AltName: Full=Pterin carbinolamine dehydratase; Short=PCD [Rhodospirillum rubrum ATCC 11170]ABC24375.1 pterin-4-alpha-carbinolamine dehydratase [Rhodospirillum rubrum ATCC 11170]AEO50126.1 pterin-4-alpha-carbinolamine dehydratase [Rhodospirillum rubrum F11]MBK5956097.1 4a-hydroxytetrah
MTDRLDDPALDRQLADHPDWTITSARTALTRSFGFKDFSEAFGFMARVALEAQAQDHHPDWSNSYNRVDITLSTHDSGGLSAKDFALAKAIDRIVG